MSLNINDSNNTQALLLTDEQLTHISEQTTYLLDEGTRHFDNPHYKELALEVLLHMAKLYGHIEALKAELIEAKKGQP